MPLAGCVRFAWCMCCSAVCACSRGAGAMECHQCAYKLHPTTVKAPAWHHVLYTQPSRVCTLLGFRRLVFGYAWRLASPQCTHRHMACVHLRVHTHNHVLSIRARDEHCTLWNVRHTKMQMLMDICSDIRRLDIWCACPLLHPKSPVKVCANQITGSM